MRWKAYNYQIYAVLLFELKKEKKKNVIKSENHEYKTIVQRTQSDNDCDTNNINNQSVEWVSDDEVIEKEKNFSFIKFSNEETFSTQQ